MHQRSTAPSAHVLTRAAAYIGVIILAAAIRLLSLPPVIWLLFFAVIIGGVVIYGVSQISGGQRNSTHNSEPTGYFLQCRACGYEWKMTNDEWEAAGQRERDKLQNAPAFLPSSHKDTVESFKKIEWKPPNPRRGIFIVVGFIVLMLITAAAGYGALWSATHPQLSYAPIIGMVTLVLLLLVYVGLMVVFGLRVTKAKVLSLLLILLIGLTGFVVLFLSR
jgi:hypothetical protein